MRSESEFGRQTSTKCRSLVRLLINTGLQPGDIPHHSALAVLTAYISVISIQIIESRTLCWIRGEQYFRSEESPALLLEAGLHVRIEIAAVGSRIEIQKYSAAGPKQTSSNVIKEKRPFFRTPFLPCAIFLQLSNPLKANSIGGNEVEFFFEIGQGR